jgi:hypothetical protein
MFEKCRQRKRQKSGFRHKGFTPFGGGCSWEQRRVRHTCATKICSLRAQNLRHRRRLDDSVDDPSGLKLCHGQLIHQFLLCSKKMKSGVGQSGINQSQIGGGAIRKQSKPNPEIGGGAIRKQSKLNRGWGNQEAIKAKSFTYGANRREHPRRQD